MTSTTPFRETDRSGPGAEPFQERGFQRTVQSSAGSSEKPSPEASAMAPPIVVVAVATVVAAAAVAAVGAIAVVAVVFAGAAVAERCRNLVTTRPRSLGAESGIRSPRLHSPFPRGGGHALPDTGYHSEGRDRRSTGGDVGRAPELVRSSTPGASLPNCRSSRAREVHPPRQLRSARSGSSPTARAPR